MNNWIVDLNQKEQARGTALVFVPHAGGGPNAFRSVAREIRRKLPVYAICYPGHENRISEPLVDDFSFVAEGIAKAASAYFEDRPFAYFGMIGSRTKVRITREKLLKEGFTEEQLDQIHAPIGLPIGGQMPAEIAVSIMAEIVQEKNRHFRTYCDEAVEAAVRRRTPGTMVTIIEKKGSSPRGTGSKMFVFRDGSTAGSIGGGKVEFEAGKHAVNIRNTETKVYELGQGAGDLGMICGGTVRVLFEPVNM